jgi:hypothetical protein
MAKKISKEQWDKALLHTHEMMEMARDLPMGTGTFYVMGCKEFLQRYQDGERTQKLYKEMMELH